MLASQNDNIIVKLSTQEIIEVMQTLNVPITEQDIIKPNPQLYQRVYEHFLELFLGISKEEFYQPSFEILDALEYPELHAESMAFMTFFTYVRSFMNDIGIANFGLNDLLKPEPKRIKIILSAVINFARFREDQLAVFEQLSKTTDDLNEKKTMLERSVGELNEKVEAIKYKRKEDEPEVQKAEAVNSALIMELKEYNRTQSQLSSNVEKLKEERSVLQDQIVTLLSFY
jgi:FtsZ-binding cell division protein ZapB